ncbi:sensor domain-containing diguanylate cyclase [Wenzhouxiangella limi]|uniref:GGDEF domain-containing protein n=1 Tax=Wenzhouxiangella limi TaxID=2707351 RepID=UPI001943D311|nr:GGDEF domain-containing protein [Wenzhouxiangella limi]
MSGDFHLLLMAVFLGLATASLLPFLLYRMVTGEYTVAAVNGVTLLLLISAFAYSWVTGRTEGTRRMAVVYLGLACFVLVNVVGHVPYWVYPIVVANFMLVGWRFALIVNISMVVAVTLGAPFFQDASEAITFLGSVIMVGLFSMIFVVNTNFHRDRLSEMVSRDALTGALNRRVLRDDLTDAIARSKRHRHPVAVALLDLDNFKQVNDTQGHEVGDQVLIDLTRIVDSQSRKSDRFYRLGGEEFVLLLDYTDREGAETALGKLSALLRSGLRSPTGPVTVSIGVAIHEPQETWSQWLARADQAMYHAKSEGKDRVVFAD